jgi:hypothetical protein
MQAEIQFKPVDGIRFELITADDYQACARLVDVCFETDEPIDAALFPKKEVKQPDDKDENLEGYLLYLKEELLALGLSHKAIDEATGAIVGVFFVCKGKVPNMQRIADVHKDLGELYVELYRQWTPQPHTTLQYLFSGVLPSHRRRGILSAARRLIIQRGQEQGFTSVYSETSSYGSRRSLEHLGAHERAFIRYSTWQNAAGEYPFAKWLATATPEKPIPHVGFAIMEVVFDHSS